MGLLVAAIPTPPAEVWSVDFMVFSMDTVSHKKGWKRCAGGNIAAVVGDLG